jgi:hypothetical protein
MSPESEWDKCVVRRHIVTTCACGVERERGLVKLIPLSGYLRGSAEAEEMILGRSWVKAWIEVDCFDRGDDGDAGGETGVVCEGDGIGVIDLESRYFRGLLAGWRRDYNAIRYTQAPEILERS